CKYLLKQNDFDIFHPTYFNPYFLKELKKPFVLTIHDMTYEALPEYFPASDPLPHYKRLLIERADKIIAISETTKTDIIKYLNTDPGKIEVIHHGIDNAASTYQTIAHLPETYVLFVGARWGYKNFYLLARAFKELSLKYPDLKLVLAGGGQLSFGDSEILVRLAIVDKVIQISVTDEELNTLYKKAICFIYPSLYEGFGLPILEAFKQGCPVLLSNSSCFKEIAGNAAKYFDCNSLQSLIHETELLITNPELRSKMAVEGYGKLTEYSMEKCLNKTINLYKAMV
ncbi:glycosyltransferase family 1 protein, partial [Pedobacter sp. HMWF019]|uniref:glycosyltransferase family 4 protein n=1 Tax=Pedobacter sp. HMWF019 TaxID=2056856 RepID=UPI000D3872A0